MASEFDIHAVKALIIDDHDPPLLSAREDVEPKLIRLVIYLLLKSVRWWPNIINRQMALTLMFKLEVESKSRPLFQS